jgi:hypothetical protein
MIKLNPVRWLSAAALALLFWGLPAQAMERIYRCGNAYTNIPSGSLQRRCVLLEGGNITTVRGTVPQRAAAAIAPSAASAPSERRGTSAAASPAPRSSGERVDAAAQRARDSDARAILETEMRRAQERLAEAQKAYAQGAPEKQGIESRHPQRYQDRVAELKATVARAQADVDSLRRELGRFGASLNASAAP